MLTVWHPVEMFECRQSSDGCRLSQHYMSACFRMHDASSSPHTCAMRLFHVSKLAATGARRSPERHRAGFLGNKGDLSLEKLLCGAT